MYLKKIFLVFLLVFSLSANDEIKNNQITTSKEYKDISKDAIFEAAKKLFLANSSNKFRVDSYRNKVVASKNEITYFPLFPKTNEKFWEIHVEEKDNSSYGKLLFYKITNYEKDSIEYADSHIYELFWKKIDYMLGLSNDWPYCVGGLCEFVSFIDKYDVKDLRETIKDIHISDREKSKSLKEMEEDVLMSDVDLSLDEVKEDILEDKEQEINAEEDALNNKQLDKEIEELDKKVNENIDINLDRIKEQKVE